MGFKKGMMITAGLAGVVASAAAAVLLWFVVNDPLALATFLAGGL